MSMFNLLKYAKLSRNQANMSSVVKGLPASSLSINEIATIRNFVIDKFLPFMGYEDETDRVLRMHGRSEMGGAQVPHQFNKMMG